MRATGGGASRARAGMIALLTGLAGLAGLAWAPGDVHAADELNLYSHRQPFLIEPFLEAFTAETGVRVNVVLRLQGPRPAAPGRGAEQPGGRGADRRYRPPQRLCGQGPAGAGRLRGARTRRARTPARSGGALVRALQACAGDRGLEGPRARRCHHALRGPGGPALGRADLHAAGQPCLQPRAHGLDDRGLGRGEGGGLGHRARRQPRPPPAGQRPGAGEGDP